MQSGLTLRYRLVGPQGVIHELDADEIEERIRRGVVKPSTLIAPLGSEEFVPASASDFAASFPETSSSLEDYDFKSVRPVRVISYLALAGLLAAVMMSFMAPLCMLIGAFARFLLTTATFGAVLALGINSALRETDTRLINISAAGFAAGGVAAWLISSGDDFSALHLGIIGLVGGAAMAFALELTRQRAVAVVVAATILFPASVLLNPIQAGTSIQLNLPMIFSPLILIFAMFVPAIPFGIFGGILGAVLSVNHEKSRRSGPSRRPAPTTGSRAASSRPERHS